MENRYSFKEEMIAKMPVIKIKRCPLAEELLLKQNVMVYDCRHNSQRSFRMPLQLTPADSNSTTNTNDELKSDLSQTNGEKCLEYDSVFTPSPACSPIRPQQLENKENAIECETLSDVKYLTTPANKSLTRKRKLSYASSTESPKLVKGADKSDFPGSSIKIKTEFSRKTSESSFDWDSSVSTPPEKRRSQRVRTPLVLGKEYVTDHYMKGVKTISTGAESESFELSSKPEDEIRLFSGKPELAKGRYVEVKTKTGSGKPIKYYRKNQTKDLHNNMCQECKEGGFFVCCSSCEWTYHLLCLNPPLLQIPNEHWQCPRCSMEPLTHAVKQILAWRWVESKRTREKYTNLPIEEQRFHPKPRKEYFVVWHDLSYWHCSWVSHQQLKFYHLLLLKSFGERNFESESYLLEEEHLPGDKKDPLHERYYKYGVRPDWLKIHRIINHRTVKKRNEYLVKWRGLPYTEATWEDERNTKLTDFDKHQEIFYEWKSIFSSSPNKSFRIKHVFRPPKEPTTDIAKQYDGQPPFVDTSKGLHLHDYQLESLHWLRKSWSRGINTILGDEMGLGKTIQAIMFIYSLFKEGHCKGPFLISAPLSTVLNWEREFELWAPDLYVVTYAGHHPNRSAIRAHEFSFKKGAVRNGREASKVTGPVRFDVLLTSYEMTSKDLNCLSSITWSALIIDEAHRLKNTKSLFFNDLIRYDANYKLLLTGTPLQNNMGELVNMLLFLSPNDPQYVSLKEELNEDNEDTKDAVELLKGILESRMLRRIKEDVLRNLPSKAEYLVKVELSPMQKSYYKFILTKNFFALNSKHGAGRGRVASLRAIFVELQKCCNHPYLFQKASEIAPALPNGNYETDPLVSASGKLSLLQKMLRELKRTGHRVLIFSHSTKMLDILEDFLEEEGYLYERIDGSIVGSSRQDRIDRYNAPDAQQFVFLLSTKAGGLGINLATADTVILYDSDWNPHNDIQALSRAHRIGQKRDVMIYRFITRNSMEERVAQVARRKLMLNHVIMETGNGDASIPLNKQQLEDIIRFGTQGLFQEDNGLRDNFTEEAIRDLLDRSKASFDRKRNIVDPQTNDFFSDVKVVSYTTNQNQEKLDNANSENNKATADPDFWEKLLKEHCGPKADSPPPESLGKGKRERKVIEYNDENSDSDSQSDFEFKHDPRNSF